MDIGTTLSVRHSGAERSDEPGIHNHGRGLWIPGLRLTAHPGMTNAVVALADSILARRVLQHLLKTVALHPRDVVLVFQKRAQRVADDLRCQRTGVEFGQRGRSVDGLGAP